MRLPRVTTRRLMVLVAVVAALLGAFQVLSRRRRLYEYNAMKYAIVARQQSYAEDGYQLGYRGARFGPLARQIGRRRAEHYEALRVKYERAARYPWLPVEPDPPDPPDWPPPK
jgi:hypothetical protein